MPLDLARDTIEGLALLACHLTLPTVCAAVLTDTALVKLLPLDLTDEGRALA